MVNLLDHPRIIEFKTCKPFTDCEQRYFIGELEIGKLLFHFAYASPEIFSENFSTLLTKIAKIFSCVEKKKYVVFARANLIALVAYRPFYSRDFCCNFVRDFCCNFIRDFLLLRDVNEWTSNGYANKATLGCFSLGGI